MVPDAYYTAFQSSECSAAEHRFVERTAAHDIGVDRFEQCLHLSIALALDEQPKCRREVESRTEQRMEFGI